MRSARLHHVQIDGRYFSAFRETELYSPLEACSTGAFLLFVTEVRDGAELEDQVLHVADLASTVSGRELIHQFVHMRLVDADVT